MKIAHITNPVLMGPDSDLFIAQPITFASMQAAREHVQNAADITFYSAQFPEDHPVIPDFFTKVPDLNRSLQDLLPDTKVKKLPLLRDILQGLFESSDAEYFIYTNVDIALMPSFYSSVKAIIENGTEAFVINRRTISDKYQSPDELPLMVAECGCAHPGYDCFVFRRDLFPQFVLNDICIGTAGIGAALLANLLAFAKHFQEFTDLHLTFHIGDDRSWQHTGQNPAQEFNLAQLHGIAQQLTPFLKQRTLPEIGQQPINEFLKQLTE